MPQIPFVGASYRARSSFLDAQVCINLFPVIGGSGVAKAVKALYGTPGRRPLVSAAESVVRGMHNPTNGGDAIVVVGSTVYRLSRTFILTAIGVVDALTTPVNIKDNGLQAMIVTGPRGYSVDLVANVVTQINSPAFYGADNIQFSNTYGILNKPGTNIFYITGSNAVTFDALDFASTESNSEPIIAFIVNHGDLIFFKESVTEIWRVVPSAGFPFAKDTNASIEHGCAAKGSVASLDNTVFWLGKNIEGGGIIWKLNGYTPQRVSTDAIEYAIAGYSRIDDAIAYSYQQEGHTFYKISFPSGNATWVYDAATQLWHQQAYLDPATGILGRDRSNCHMFFNGKHITGDYLTGDLRTLDLDYYLDGLDPMPAIRAAAYVYKAELGLIAHVRLQVDIEPGVGLNNGQGIDSTAWLDWSDDGGKNWSNSHAASLGVQGKYRSRLFWTRLGSARARIYRITISDPIKRVILGAVLNPGR